MEVLEFRLLGACEIRVHGGPLPPPRYRKEWWLLALLVLQHDRDVSRDALAADFWPDSDPDRALLYLRRSLTNLRKALGPEAHRLRSPTPRTLRLDMDGASADVVAFDDAVRRARRPGPECEAAWAAAAELYGGPLLPDCDEPWVLPDRARRAEDFSAALEALGRAALERGDPAGAVPPLRRLTAANPLRESGHATLIRALAEAGDRAAATRVFQDLRRRLRDELNAAPSPETVHLYESLMARAAAPAALPPAAASDSGPRQSHLPVPLTALIGRAREVEEVTARLRRDRLVTLLGEGGIGKTRLAIASAGAALPDFPAGVWFVDLAPLASSDLVPEAVAQTLGLGEEAGRPAVARAAEAIGTAAMLLILDNCEHVPDASASLAARLLEACPRLRVLATSRQALGVMGERVFAVPPLRLPPPAPAGPTDDPERTEKNVFALMEYDSARLFLERATQARPGFRLSRRSADAVAEICRRLEGLPLALELAAARVRALSPQEICARLEDRLGLLATGNRGAAPRHQTLRALIDWSYTLLSGAEKALLRRLSVFAGGWEMEMAEAICDGTAGDVLDGVQSLVDKSLVSAETLETADGEMTRFRLRETVRQYARERLREAGEEPDARDRHRDTFVRLAAEARPAMQGPRLAPWLDRLEREIDNFRAALEWCVSGPEAGTQAGLQLAADLFFLWWVRGYFAEGQRWYDAVLRRDAAPTAERARALSRAGGLLSVAGRGPAARPLFEEGLTIARQRGDRKAEANLLCNLGDITTGTDLAAARSLLAQSLVIHREVGNAPGTAHAALLLGNVALQQNRLEEAEALYGESLTLYRALENPQKMGHALWCLARAELGRRRFAPALSRLEECVGLFRGLSDPWGLSAALALAGEAALQAGDTDAARPLLAEHLVLVQRMGLRRSAPWVLRCFGRLASAKEAWPRTVRLFAAAAALQSDSPPDVSARPPADDDPSLSLVESAALAASRRALGPDAFVALWAAGRALSLEQAAAEALHTETSWLH